MQIFLVFLERYKEMWVGSGLLNSTVVEHFHHHMQVSKGGSSDWYQHAWSYVSSLFAGLHVLCVQADSYRRVA